MKKVWIPLGVVLGLFVGYVTAQVVIIQRPLSSQGLSAGVGYGTRVPTVADDGRPPTDGELFVVRAAGTSDPDVMVYSSVDGAWQSVGSNITTSTMLGSDEDDTITVNGPVVFEVTREDFDGPNLTAVDMTNGDFAVSVADTEANMLIFDHLRIYYRIELAFGGTYTPATFMNNLAFNIDDATILDVADNDALDYVIGGPPTQAFAFDTDSAETAYCEISATITTIANVSADDFWFGFMTQAAIADTFADAADATNRAIFIVNDTSGDLDIETELASGGTLNDDGGVGVNGETHVLRVAVDAANVDFYIDGTQVTQTNAVLNPATGQMLVCRIGMRSAGTAKAGVALNYIEVGRAQ